MNLIFEKKSGRSSSLISDLTVKEYSFDASVKRQQAPELPVLPEIEVDRHYHALSERTFGVCDGFYPLGSCTMKYNPAVNEDLASLKGFTGVHPLQDEGSVEGSLEVLFEMEKILGEVTAMDAFTFQPAAGAHGELTGLLMIKAYHKDKGNDARTKIIVPDSAHGTNPASAAMAGFSVVNIPSTPEGFVDIEALREVCGDDTAGLMLTNPNTVGVFDPNIKEITDIVHAAGGLCYYDGANLNAVMGIARPGDMGFDVVHLNLHKTFSTPHGGGGPGAGPVGCKEILRPYMPGKRAVKDADGKFSLVASEKSFGDVRAFFGNFLVVVKAFAYALSCGGNGLYEASFGAVLNANYLRAKIADILPSAIEGYPMHEFVISLDDLKEKTGVSALDFAKALQEYDMHPPTMYFPLIVHEALMIEPTETETRETLDKAAEVFRTLYEKAFEDPDYFHAAPHGKAIGRPDEVTAARNPILKA